MHVRVITKQIHDFFFFHRATNGLVSTSKNRRLLHHIHKMSKNRKVEQRDAEAAYMVGRNSPSARCSMRKERELEIPFQRSVHIRCCSHSFLAKCTLLFTCVDVLVMRRERRNAMSLVTTINLSYYIFYFFFFFIGFKKAVNVSRGVNQIDQIDSTNHSHRRLL